jgi:hypothetical protein
MRIAPLYQAHTIMNGMYWNGLMAYMIELEGAPEHRPFKHLVLKNRT